MTTHRKRRRALIVLGLAGLASAVLALLEPLIPGLADLCSLLSGGCRDTSAFTLLGIPISILGLAYYAVLLVCIALAPSMVFPLVMAGAGVETTFLYAMVAYGIFCPFCLLNLLVVVVLVILLFRRARGWEAMAIGLLFLILSLVPFTLENTPPVTPTRAFPDPAVVARVEGTPVTAEELERSMATSVYDARMKLYVEKAETLNRIIDERLLHLEARRLGTTVEEVRSAATRDTAPVEPEEITAYLTANPAILSAWEGTGEELRERVKTYLKVHREAKAMRAFLDDLRSRYQVEVLLEEPPLPLTHVALGNSPSLGPADSPVIVVEFSDYLCSACRRAHEIIMDIREDYRGRIRWVYKDLPLERHERAFKLAEAARCAADQDMFWEYQDLLFMTPGDVDLQGLLELAEDLGMDVRRFEQCIREEKHRQDVLADIQAAKEAGVDATPTFIVNGKLRPGIPRPGELQALIEAELDRASRP
ncbi:MAG: thioredoxin domain-containing protein [Thermodesulfobacteriota bacterium]